MKYENKGVTAKDFDTYWQKTGQLFDERLEEVASLWPGGKTVDLGGGSGSLAKKINATLVDWSPVACKQAEELGVKTICSNVLDFLKKTRNKYDVVILADVLEEMRADETKLVLDGVNKICKKYFILSTPTHENYLNLSTHQVIYSRGELLKMLGEYGFKLEKEIPYSDRIIARFVYENNA